MTIFVGFISLVLAIFIAGIILFVVQYRRRRIEYTREKASIKKQHQLDLLNTQLNAQEQTMQFIGQEIHDSVAQKLTLASIYTQKLEYENEFPWAGPRLQVISSVINDALHELRDLSRTLTDNRIQHTGLDELIAAECEKVNSTGICRLDYNVNFSCEISVMVKSFLLRIIQEFIQNSLKHSGAKSIRLAIESGEEMLSIIAHDDGKGFDSTGRESEGMGLSNMKRRVDLIGGTYKMHSEPGKGTTLAINIPVEKLTSIK